ncbi:DUF4238 domain-containing protein [Rhizobium sp. Leaf391]|uniref:DUF4238 domain-containing protein n=1 Tax=Rhizobium sp. Leaf391 TaxID=1736360 RepID=UPI00244EF90D|nr:DUF4238 domain-containing protein [Rhizobium sp. Leaf391]
MPQFYLKPWLGADNKLTEYRRLKFPHEQFPRLEIKRRGTGETGYAENLYIIPGATPETKQNIEKIFMGAVDKKAADARDQLLQSNIPTDPELRHAWARFLLSLIIRTPEEIRAFKVKVIRDMDVPDPAFQARYDQVRKENWPSTLEDYMKLESPKMLERTAIMVATKLIQNENVLRTFMGAMWWVLDTSAVSRRILTSDHPVIMTNGLGRPDGHFALPLSPTKVFVAFMNAEFGEAVRRIPIGRIVREVNDGVIGGGRRSVYAADEQSTTEVKKRMGKRDYMLPFPREIMKN